MQKRNLSIHSWKGK